MSSCYDDNDFISGELGTAPTDVEVTLDFEPLIVADNNTSGTRTSGQAIENLENLTIFLYKFVGEDEGEGELYDIRYKEELHNLSIVNKEKVAEEGSSATGIKEPAAAMAKFTMTNVEPGYYYVYAVANLGEDYIPGNKTEAKEKFANASALKEIALQWNSENISANNQMFGYMTDSGDTNFTDEFKATPVGIGKGANKLHCWLKRAVSKVTVAFDGSGLHDNIRIYIKSVTIKDIPLTCYLGEDNRVEGEGNLIEEGETLYYNADGVLEDGKENTDSDWHNWLLVSKGSGKKGAVSKDINGNEVYHSDNDAALYFFENCQGDYEGKKDYDKRQDPDKTGWIPTKPGQDGYKDNVPLGTYIEVDAYYVSDNQNQVSQGPIKYRFMLGQNTTYDYNAIRNHHYKVTLGFRGYANQPDWHVVYKDEGEVFVTVNNYYMSYQYNRKSVFPIRLKGSNVSGVTVEIVENNWAPYEGNSTPNPEDDVPQERVGVDSHTESVVQTRFLWNKQIYDNKTSGVNFYYGLQNAYNKEGTGSRTYTDKEKEAGAPDKVTPIWAGFLALMVPGKTREDIPTNLFPVGEGFTYSDTENIAYLKNYFYGKGGGKGYENNIPQNYRTFTKEDLTFAKDETLKFVGCGNNTCEIRKSPDGSITILLPMWTRPKNLLGISGFSGNNPYDAYRRRAKVMVTADFGEGSGKTSKVVVKDVFQVRRVVNPMGIWHKHDNTDPFHVELCVREDASTINFTTLKSDGFWKAYVQRYSQGDKFVTLQGGIKTSGDTIIGSTDTPITFDINFNSTTEYGTSRCALVRVEYHGATCGHTIFVRQGYRTAQELIEGEAKWSSFSLYSTKTNGTDVNDQYASSWNNSNYIEGDITASPLSLGTFFKRGNYNGFLIKNNKTYGASVAPNQGYFEMSNGMNAKWGDVKGLAYSQTYSKLTKWNDNAKQNTFEWRQIKVKIKNPDTGVEFTRVYRVPEYEDFNVLLRPEIDFGYGVLYADGTKGTQMDVDYAYGHEDFDNKGLDSGNTNENGRRGMRGIMCYNINNAHQLFFPIGARGLGRRTITGYTSTSYNYFGILRYGALTEPLKYETGKEHNQYRPIPYDLPASPGAIYWLNKIKGNFLSWDMNYFDQNFNAYDYGTSYTGGSTGNENYGGDALPIKLIYVRDI